jgi:hypothetical protein
VRVRELRRDLDLAQEARGADGLRELRLDELMATLR